MIIRVYLSLLLIFGLSVFIGVIGGLVVPWHQHWKLAFAIFIYTLALTGLLMVWTTAFGKMQGHDINPASVAEESHES